MADHVGGQPRCTSCGAEARPDAAFCSNCGRALGPPPGQVQGYGQGQGYEPPPWTPSPFAPAPSPLARLGPAGTARGWGAVSLAFGALVLLGSAIPWMAGSTFAFTDDMGSASPLLVIGLVGVLGGVDGLRGSLLGPAVAAGAGSVFFLVQMGMVRALTQLPGLGMGGGGVAWTLAAVAALLLVIGALAFLRADREQGVAPGWTSVVVLVAGAVWVAGMVVPSTPGLSLADHVEHVLLGGDTFSDVMTVAYIGIPAAFVVLAAATRSRAAHGLAAGSMVFWVLAAVTAAAGYGSSSDGALRYAFGHFWPMLLGSLGVAIGGCVAMLLPSPAAGATAGFEDVTGCAASDPTRPAGARPGVRPVAALAPVVGVALLPLAGIVGAAQYAQGDDAFGLASAGTPIELDDVDEVDEGEPVDATGTGVPDGNGGSDDTGGSFDVVCTGLVDSSVQSVWQDVDGAIHVVIFVDNGCETGQRLDDADASFTLTSNGADVADATFDFASRPVVVPALSGTEAEIVFGPETFVDLAAVETLGLGAGTTSGASSGSGSGSLGISYSYTCTDAPGATAPSAGAPVAGEATTTPIDPETTSEGDALARLGEIAAADAPFVESDVIDRWVPQISSKRPNVPLPDGSVWDAVSILDDHRDWRERFPRVRLLWSGDYSTFELTDFWVTIVAVPYDTPEGALGWCDANALPAEDCYAKLISHTHPHDDSTRHR